MSNTPRLRPAPGAAKAAARKAEATDEPIAFEFEGETYEIPASADWPLSAVEALEDEKGVRFARELLGPEQWAAFRSVPRTVGDLDRFAQAMQEAAGLGN